jgi:hypothetical protein
MSTDKKKKLGQFYTTNYNYIFQNLNIDENTTTIIEPFAGKGDLLKFFNKNEYITEAYDIDPKIESIIKRDTLLNKPIYKNKFVITNPPYLARNKSNNKELYDKFNTNDLYKCFIEQLIEDSPCGGIIIIPLNFWCSIRKNDIDLRKRFLKIFDIIQLNIFEEKVFDDTKYSVSSFQFCLKKETNSNINNNNNHSIKITIYPQKQNINTTLNEGNNFLFGGEIYKLKQQKNIKIDRMTHINKNKNTLFNTNILLKCIDDSDKSKLGLSYVEDSKKEKHIDDTPNLSGRSYALLIINKTLTKEKQLDLINKFNSYINDLRNKYNSLFLTNYRESNTIARKRISFSLAFEIINYLLVNELNLNENSSILPTNI